MRKIYFAALTLAVLTSQAGCSRESTAGAGPATAATAVIPTGGSTGVDPNAPVTIRFNHWMGTGMEQYLVLHEGGLTGPAVPGRWAWNQERSEVVFHPAAPLRARTRYTLHMGGGIRDADGRTIDMRTHMRQMGGQWATGHMLGGGMMGGSSGAGGMMGPGWRHANGSYGMVFTFTTA